MDSVFDFAIWEEVARDGAQAGTLLTGPQRIEIAETTARLLGPSAPQRLIFAAGFPSVCREEFEVVRQLVHASPPCWLATHGRAVKEDIILAARALEGAERGWMTFFAPASPAFRAALGFGTAARAQARVVDAARRALDLASGAGLQVGIALADAARADLHELSDLAAAIAAEGVTGIKLCDSVGYQAPSEASRMVGRIRAALPDSVQLGVHHHNDFGLGLANSLEALRAGATIVASSWLGLGERAGLPRTEELLLLLSQRPELLKPAARGPTALSAPPDLSELPKLVAKISAWTGQALKRCEPVTGERVSIISTGTPALAPSAFRAFDPGIVLGRPCRAELSHLSGRRHLQRMARERGVELDGAPLTRLHDQLKSWAYANSRSTIPDEVFEAAFLNVAPDRVDLASGTLPASPPLVPENKTVTADFDLENAIVHAAGLTPAACFTDLAAKLNRYGFAVLRTAAPRALVTNIISCRDLFGPPVAHSRANAEGITVIAPSLGAMTGYIGTSCGPHPLHTDGQYLEQPPSISIIGCEVPARAGGETVLASSRRLVQHLLGDHGDDVLQLLKPDVYMIEREGAAHRRPILRIIDGARLSLAFRYDDVLAVRVQPSVEGVISSLMDWLKSPENVLRFKMEAGDVLVLDNLSMLHGREAFERDSPRRFQRITCQATTALSSVLSLGFPLPAFFELLERPPRCDSGQPRDEGLGLGSEAHRPADVALALQE